MAYSKEEREKNKIILLATLNYLLEYHSGDMVFDGFSPSKQWYLGDLQKTELDIKKSRSTQIKNRLDRHILLLKYRYDLGLNRYLRENTSYDIDIFETFKADVMPIVVKESIDANDIYPIERYLKAYEMHPDEQERVAVLKKLLIAYEAKIKRLMGSDGVTKTSYFIIQGNKGKEVSETELHEMDKKWLLAEETAPNGTYKLSVQISGKGADASTYVNISLAGGTGAIYAAIGERLPIKAYWKDDKHVVIETKKEYKFYQMYSQVSSYGDLVNIEYRYF